MKATIITKNKAANDLILLGQKTERLNNLLESLDEIDSLIYAENDFEQYQEIRKNVINLDAELQYIFNQYQKRANELTAIIRK